MHLITDSVSFYGGHPTQLGLAHQFNLSDENNIPTWFSSFALALCAILLTLIWNASRLAQERYASYWLILAMIFILLSLDEAASLHEMLGQATRALLHKYMPTSNFFQPGSYLPIAWLLPGTFIVLATAILFGRFLANLPKPTCRLFCLAGGLYVGGAMGMEYLGAIYWGHYGHNMIFTISEVCEEGLEMLGTLIFLYALLGHIATYVGPIQITFETD
jgi:hypothetical protein